MRPVLLALSLCACGGGLTSVDGEVAGTGIEAHDVLAMVTPGDGGSLSIWIGDHDNLCDEMHGSQFLKNLHMLVLTLGVVSPAETLVAADSAGTYAVAGRVAPGERLAAGAFWDIGQCLSKDPLSANSGTVTLTHYGSVGGKIEVEGTFDVQFFGGELKGRFSNVVPCTVERGFFLLCK